MKYRILEKEGSRFYIQCKRKYWFWVDTYVHGRKLRERIRDFASDEFKLWYEDYKSAKENQDRMIKYSITLTSLSKHGPKIYDIVDMDSEEDIFTRLI